MVWYKDVLSSVREGKDWALYSAIEKLDPQGRVKKIKEVFLTVCHNEDDKAAAQYFAWLLMAIDDVYLLGLTKKEGGYKVLPYGSEVAQALSQAERANLSMALHRELPISQVGTARQILAEDESRLVPVNVPTLLKTKEAMLTEIAGWGRDTKNEDEADAIFVFLRDLPLCFDGSKVRLEAVRKATSVGFPVSRLTRQLFFALAAKQNLGPLDRDEESFAQVLATARGRNIARTALETAALEMAVLMHTKDWTRAAFELLEKAAGVISALDAETREFLKVMKGRDTFPYLYGEIHLSYPDTNTIDVVVKTEAKGHFSEKEWQDQFELAREHVRKWKRGHPNRKVNLTLTVKNHYEPKGKALFNRTEQF